MFRNSRSPVFRVLLGLAGSLAVALCAGPGAAQAHILSGRVAFSGLSQEPYPVAVCILTESGTATVVDMVGSDPGNGDFAFTEVDDGTYDVEIVAPCWVTAYLADIVISGGNGGLGTITLAADTSPFDTIQLLGDFNGWNLAGTPSMTFDGACTWVDTLTLQPGTYNCKFVTNGSYDNPPDYGGNQGQTLALPGGPFPTYYVTGEGTAHHVLVAVAGDYIFTLNEAMASFTVEYEGTLPAGEIRGGVTFEGIAAAPYPIATVKLYESGSATVLRTTTTSSTQGTFSFATVPNGSYDLAISSPCFVTETRTSIPVSGGTANTGAIALDAGVSAFATIHLVGDFTSWDIGGSPSMVQDANCRWTASILLTPGTYNMKYVTDGAWGNDYGGDESVVLTAPGTYPVKAGVAGAYAFRMQFPAEDTYTFVLDEARQEVTVTDTTPVERMTWGAIKARY